MHLFKNTAGRMAELDTYAIDEAHDPAFGDLSVHEVATSQKLAKRTYLSYYSGGRSFRGRRAGRAALLWPRDLHCYGSENSCVCGFRWSRRSAPPVSRPLKRNTFRPRVMSDS